MSLKTPPTCGVGRICSSKCLGRGMRRAVFSILLFLVETVEEEVDVFN